MSLTLMELQLYLMQVKHEAEKSAVRVMVQSGL